MKDELSLPRLVLYTVLFILGGWLIVRTVKAKTGVTSGVERMAKAIAFAEGYGKPGAIPTVRNNPGDLIMPGDTSPSWFATPEDGWRALHNQLILIASGRSRVYTADMSIAEMADKYTATEQDYWAANVANYLAAHGAPGTRVLTELRGLLV